MRVQQQPTATNVFAHELNWFSLDHVRDFVLHVFGELCPQYFWYIRASQRGHHHPLMRTYGGLVHHVKLALRFARSFSEMSPYVLSELKYNQVLAAVMLHDMMKRGEVEDELQTWSNHKEAARSHGRYCADQIREHLFDGNVPFEYQPILDGIRLHMGRWTWEITQDERHELVSNYVVQQTHLADYAASRSLHKWIGERYTDESMGYLQ